MNYPKPQIHQVKKTTPSRYCYTPQFKNPLSFNNPLKAHPLKIPSWFVKDTLSPRMPDFDRSIYGDEISVLVQNTSNKETDVFLFGPWYKSNFGNPSNIIITAKHGTYSSMCFKMLDVSSYIGQIDLLSSANSDIIKNAYQAVIFRDWDPIGKQRSTIDWNLRSINALRCFVHGSKAGEMRLSVPPYAIFEINVYLEK